MLSMPLRIRSARTQSAMTQVELARRLGVQRSAVTQWERDHGTTPSVSHLAQIARETDVSFEWLATGRGPSRANGQDFVTAVVVQDYALDELESRLLAATRRLSSRRREAVVRLLEVLAN